jgi:hypothetical protein
VFIQEAHKSLYYSPGKEDFFSNVFNFACQVWIHLAELFSRRRLKCEKVKMADNICKEMANDHMVIDQVS